MRNDEDVSPAISPAALAAVDGDLTASQRSLGALEVRAASLRGPGHRALGEPRQDAAGVLGLEGHEGIAVGVADGIGSAPFSHLGAQAGLRAALAVLAQAAPLGSSPEPGDLEAALDAAVDRVGHAAHAVPCDEAAVSTTLVAAWIGLQTFDDGSIGCVVLSVGDSAAYLLDPESVDEDGVTWRRVFDAGDPMVPSNVVRWHLPRRPGGAVWVGLRLPPGTALLLCTDGVADPVEADGGFAEQLARRWAQPRPLLHFVADLSYDTHHDDRSAVVVWNTTPSEGGGR